MASKDYLFVNKDSRSPSLSRNTGTEASLASRVNKHVQQQRFWRPSGPRRSWYRPFVRSHSSSSAPSPTRTETPLSDEPTEPNQQVSCDQKSPSHLRKSISSSDSSVPSRPATASSGPGRLVLRQDTKSVRGSWVVPPELTSLIRQPGNHIDPFITVVVPLTPALVEALHRHLTWAITASLTDFTVQEGVKRVFSVILQDKMHAAAFLAMTTAQQRRTSELAFPHDQSPEFYAYRATKLIRQHVQGHQGSLPPHTIVDIFRLAMCEWINGNQEAARIHIAQISKNWSDFEPATAVDRHRVEVCSTEDIFIAIDVDKKPLLDVTWEPDLFIGPHALMAGSRSTVDHSFDLESISLSKPGVDRRSNIRQLEDFLRRTQSPMAGILYGIMTGLVSFPRFSGINFGSALTGPTWIMKRRIHAALHRLQALEVKPYSADDSIRRALIIVLLLASTTAERRLVRVNLAQLAARLENSLQALEKLQNAKDSHGHSTSIRDQLQDPGLWLWLYIAGLTAAKESSSQDRVRQWFTKRALLLAVRLCGPFATVDEIEKILSNYLYFENAMGRTIEALSAAIASQTLWQANWS